MYINGRQQDLQEWTNAVDRAVFKEEYFGTKILTVGPGQQFATITDAVGYALTRPQFSSTVLSGTVSVSLDGKTVTGVGTNFLTAFTLRKYISFGATGKYYAIKSVASDTVLRLVAPFKETTVAGGTAVSGLPVMNIIQIHDTLAENVYINSTGLAGGAQIANTCISFVWTPGAQYSGLIEHSSLSGQLQFHNMQQLDNAAARIFTNTNPLPDPHPMMDMLYNNIQRRSVDEVDFILNINCQRAWLRNSHLEGNFDVFMPGAAGECYVDNSHLRSFPGDELDNAITNQPISAILTQDNGLFIANNSTFTAGCYGAGACNGVMLQNSSSGGVVHAGSKFQFNNCEIIAEKVPGSTEVGSTSFAFVNIESDNATIELNNTPFIFIGSPTPGASWRNFRSEPTVTVASQITVKGHGMMQGLSSATTFNVINCVDNNAVQTVAYAAAITPNPNFGSRINIGAMTGALTINAPTNPQNGQYLDFAHLQDGTGGRIITWNAAYKKAADGAGTANQRGSTRFRCDGTNWIQQGGALTYFT